MVVVKDELKHLRDLRKRECFAVINRGKAWYDLLTLEQEAELKQWYADWLHVTETKIVPKKLSWLNDKLDTEVEYL